ncbi:hypothetical protein HFP72_03100 [Nocardiopsis sp. ARC36]
MSWSHVIETHDLLDTPTADGASVAEYLRRHGAADGEVAVETVAGEGGPPTSSG